MADLKGETPATRVVVATANEQILAAATETLEAAGYMVFGTGDGQAVLLWAMGEEADLYLLDRDLPGMDGVRLARHLRQSYDVGRSRILILHPHDEATGYAAEVQATDVLLWPFTGVELLLCVTRHLDPEASSNRLPGATEP